MATYGYCRISTGKQRIERQIDNIKTAYPEAVIIQEVFTGTKFQGRKEFCKLLKNIKPGDTIVFDSVSRMSRDAAEGWNTYEELNDKGVNLIFLKESYINTDVYKEALRTKIQLTGEDIADIYIEATNKVLKKLAQNQIKIAFDQSEKEVADLHKRTSEGVRKAQEHGKQVGRQKGATLVTKKSINAKEIIRKHNKTYGGTLNDIETMKIAGISRATYYKYKQELNIEFQNEIDNK